MSKESELVEWFVNNENVKRIFQLQMEIWNDTAEITDNLLNEIFKQNEDN